jgi:cytochrome c-type biogenesis protein
MLEPLVTSFGLGLVATASPCLLPLYPGNLASLAAIGGAQRAGGRALAYALLMLAGVLTMMLPLGLAMALLQVVTGNVLRVAIPLADLVIVAIGVLLLGKNPCGRLAVVRKGPTVRRRPWPPSCMGC